MCDSNVTELDSEIDQLAIIDNIDVDNTYNVSIFIVVTCLGIPGVIAYIFVLHVRITIFVFKTH